MQYYSEKLSKLLEPGMIFTLDKKCNCASKMRLFMLTDIVTGLDIKNTVFIKFSCSYCFQKLMLSQQQFEQLTVKLMEQSEQTDVGDEKNDET